MSSNQRKLNLHRWRFALPLHIQAKQKYLRTSNFFEEFEKLLGEEVHGFNEYIDFVSHECDVNLEKDAYRVDGLDESRQWLKNVVSSDLAAGDFSFSKLIKSSDEDTSISDFSENEFQDIVADFKNQEMFKKQVLTDCGQLLTAQTKYSSGILGDFGANQSPSHSQNPPEPTIGPTQHTTTIQSSVPGVTSGDHKVPVKDSAGPVSKYKRKKAAPEKAVAKKSRVEIYSEICKKLVPKQQKSLFQLRSTRFLVLKKESQACIKEVKRRELKSLKLEHDFISAARKVAKTVINYWREKERAEKYYRKKCEKQALEQQKKDSEIKEMRRQQLKLNMLITQTEMYAVMVGADDGGENQKTSNSILQQLDEVDMSQYLMEEECEPIITRENIPQIDSFKLKEIVREKVVSAVNKQRESVSLFDESLGAELRIGLQERLNVANAETNIEINASLPTIFKGKLKKYQIQGFNWLVSIYEKGINGILADEMGLGKTVQTISLMAYLAEIKNLWGPFFIIAPSTTLHNWQNEINRFVPDFRVLPYWGNTCDRKIFRNFWNNRKSYIQSKEDAPFHVIITSYQLAVRDTKYFQRIRWLFLVLDEAQAIKSNTSQRWKALLSFNCRNRLLLTGTPIQNSMAELWALLHFIMPTLFDCHQEFNEWFSKGIENRVENKGAIDQAQLSRLHMIIKPFILRRTKKEVENELSDKIEIMLKCNLSLRQKHLYDAIKNKICLDSLLTFTSKVHTNKEKESDDEYVDDMEDVQTEGASTENRLMNFVMQFRKVCNHPALFERSSFQTPLYIDIEPKLPSGFLFEKRIHKDMCAFPTPFLVFDETHLINRYFSDSQSLFSFMCLHPVLDFSSLSDYYNNPLAGIKFNKMIRKVRQVQLYKSLFHKNWKIPLQYRSFFLFEPFLFFGANVADHSLLLSPSRSVSYGYGFTHEYIYSMVLHETGDYIRDVAADDLFIRKVVKKREFCGDYPHLLQNMVTKKVASRSPSSMHRLFLRDSDCESVSCNPKLSNYFYSGVHDHESQGDDGWVSRSPSGLDSFKPSHGWASVRSFNMQDFICDSGKLAVLDNLLFYLKGTKHRVLIYSLMTRMLNLLEEYLNYRKHTFIRLDGSSRIEERREMVEAFQSNPSIFVFLLSTRAGGIGINLTAADTVIFYDSDWNPTVDQQAMDRAHRLGQTRQVVVYRLVSSDTIEERILERAKQKSEVQNMIISGSNASFKSREVVSLLLDDAQLESQFRQKQAESRKRKRSRKSVTSSKKPNLGAGPGHVHEEKKVKPNKKMQGSEEAISEECGEASTSLDDWKKSDQDPVDNLQKQVRERKSKRKLTTDAGMRSGSGGKKVDNITLPSDHVSLSGGHPNNERS